MTVKTFTPIIANRMPFMRASTTGLAARQPENPVIFRSANRDGLRFTISVLEVLGSADSWKLKAAFQLCQWGVLGGAPNTSWDWYDLEDEQKAFMLPEGDFGTDEVTVSNLATNPSLETDAVGWGQVAGTGGAASGAHMTDGDAYHGQNYRRMTWTTGTTSPSGGQYGVRTEVAPNVPHTFGLAVRTSKSIRGRWGVRWANNTHTWGESSILPANTWVYGGISAVAPPGQATGTAMWEPSGEPGVDAGAANWNVGDWQDVDAHSVVEGSRTPTFFTGTQTFPAETMVVANSADAIPVHRSRSIRGFGDFAAIRMFYETVNPSSDFGLVLSITAN